MSLSEGFRLTPQFSWHLWTIYVNKDRKNKTYGTLWLNIWIIDSCPFLIFLNAFNEDFWSLLSFSLFFVCFIPTFLRLFKVFVPLLACVAKIVEHASFVFWHQKNAISWSAFGILHIVRSSGKDLTHKLLLLRHLPVCLPVS